jgi:hypothetical protein
MRFQILATIIFATMSSLDNAQTPPPTSIAMPQYSARVEAGDPPRLTIERNHQAVFVFPAIAGLASSTQPEHLSGIEFSTRESSAGSWELNATAQSSLWTNRRFQWRFFPDHIEFQQFASGHGKLGRSYFLSNGVSNRWDNGTTDGRDWDTTIYADRYFAPNPNHANQFEFNIAMPQILGFSVAREPQSEEDFRPERMTGIFAPPPLFLAFHMDKTWIGIGLGAHPGDCFRASIARLRTASRRDRKSVV